MTAIVENARPAQGNYPGNERALAQPIIQVKNVSKSFGKDKTVVQDLNFEVQPGQIFCLLGPSGSGKSTTMRMLTGLYRPSEGDVRVFGEQPHRFNSYMRGRLGYMPQQFVLFPELSTWGNVNFVASVYGMSWFGRRPKIKRALEFVDLWDAKDKLASQLSGGMQRRLELAATLVHNPQLIFADEPTAGIDPVLRAKFWEHFRELRDQGRTLFITTQYVTEADYCDRVAILNRGRMLALGAPEDIRKQAFGGEIINLSLEFVTTEAIRLLQKVEGLKFIRFLNAQDLQLVAENAGTSLPLVVAALQEANIPIKSIEQYRPDFEEVFVELMEQDDEGDQSDEQNEQLFRQTLAKNQSAQPLPPQRPATQQRPGRPPRLTAIAPAAPQREQPRPQPQPAPQVPPIPAEPPIVTMPEPAPNPAPFPAEPAPPVPASPDSLYRPNFEAQDFAEQATESFNPSLTDPDITQPLPRGPQYRQED